MEIRTVDLEHLEKIIELDHDLTGENHAQFFENHFNTQLLLQQNDLMFGVFEGDHLLGFLLASIRQLAFGQHQKIAYLEMIEVSGKHQKRGTGTILMEEFKRRLKKFGINRIITLVQWKETHLLEFFQAHRMEKGDMIQLELFV
ncbi:MAG: GNAT family N-acetyltransferase [Candidatus Hodarchaeales archaeon]